MKRMLFNATHPEEMRVALVDGQRLLDLDIESTASNQKKGNIYKATVSRIEPSLEAAFVDYGSERQGFLPLKEVARHYFSDSAQGKPIHKVGIADALREKQEILVQIEKEERGNKGAALTTFISLAGRFLVLMPDNPKGGGISRRIAGEERETMREILNNLELPGSHSVILRTAGMGRSQEEIAWDANFLMKLWGAIEQAAESESAPKLVYQDSSLIVRALRDYVRDDVREIIIDDPDVYERALNFVNLVMPERNTRIKLYEETLPLLARYQVEQQIEAAFSREIRLPSGGAIVIDHTEAVVTIDINSAKSTKGSDIEDTALHTNLEAAEEIARQLKIRDIGGLIVIDFIDMQVSKNQRKVEQSLISLVKSDRARIQIGKISKFGLLEMSRQRIRGALVESNYHTCPRCNGNGIIRGVVSSALSILRVIEEESLKENTEAVLVHLPVDTATYLLNEKRYDLALMERRHATRITIAPNDQLQTPYFNIERLRGDEYGQIAHIPSHRIELDDESITKPGNVRPVVLEPASVQMEQVTDGIEPAPISGTRPARKSGGNRQQSSRKPARKDTAAASTSASAPTSNKAKSEGEEKRRDDKGVFRFVSRLFGGNSAKQEADTGSSEQDSSSVSENDSAQEEQQPRSRNQRHNNNRRSNNRRHGSRGGQRNASSRQRNNQRNNDDGESKQDNTNASSDKDNRHNRSDRNRRAHQSRQRNRGRNNNQNVNRDNTANTQQLDNAGNQATEKNTAPETTDTPKPRRRPSKSVNKAEVAGDNGATKVEQNTTSAAEKPRTSKKSAGEGEANTQKAARPSRRKKTASDSASDSASKETKQSSKSQDAGENKTPTRRRRTKAESDSTSDSASKETKQASNSPDKGEAKTPTRRRTTKTTADKSASVKADNKSDKGTEEKPKPRRRAPKKADDSAEAKAPPAKRAPRRTKKAEGDNSDGNTPPSDN